ncbi:MAG: hypothetical protein ACJ8H8_30745 [Geminicoccaceae bacterium]
MSNGQLVPAKIPLTAEVEAEIVAKIEAENLQMEPRDADGEVTGRAQHPKNHGCVAAVFQVAGDVPQKYRHGVFTNPGARFNALIRFSNGRQQDDSKADVHGMAIKLLDVPGDRPAGQEWQTAQDFVLIDDELFFTGDLVDYEAANRIIAGGVENALSRRWLKFIPTLITGAQLEKLDGGKLLPRLQAVADQRPASPLATNYWSSTPYALGPAAVKYMAVCPAPRQQPGAGQDRDYLRAALAADLTAGPASFDFVAHVQTDPHLQPIENPTVSWSANGASKVKLATITIPTQQVPSPSGLAENIVYSPWNCLEAHAPLGKINLARKQVYEGLSTTRHQGNGPDRQAWANVLPQDRRPV